VIRVVAAAIGFAIALFLAPYLQRPASPHELPGAMQARGLSPSGPPNDRKPSEIKKTSLRPCQQQSYRELIEQSHVV